MSTPEARLWTNLRKAMPKQTAAFRIENRAGPGTPDVAVVFNSVTAWLELKAPKSQPKTAVDDLSIRAQIFGFDQETWENAHENGVTSHELMESAPTDRFLLYFASPKYVRSTQAAWHARVFSVGGVSFFLEKTQGPSSYRLFSPYVDQESGSLRLGLVCESKNVSVVLYALRLCAEMHSLAALRLDV